MTRPGYTRTQAKFGNGTQVVTIVSVDLQKHVAQAITMQGGVLPVDCNALVGAVQVTPTPGERWLVERTAGTQWTLTTKVPTSVPATWALPTGGQTQLGSGGPVQLHGDVTANGNLAATGAVTPLACVTASRPVATSLPPGSMIYDTTLGIPVFSDGTVWRNAAGVVA